MNSFKEWLSDYLRYFMLGLIFLLAILAIVLGVRLYQKSQAFREAHSDPDSIQIITERLSEETESEAEQTETKESETERQTERVTEKVTEKETEPKAQETISITETTKIPETQKTTETTKLPETQKTTETTKLPETQKTTETTKLPETQKTTEPKIPETKAPETDPPQTEPPQPVYLTMTGTCYFRSYADYGDNIIGEYPAGTVVEFLEDVGGWYKVQVDGMVGYMGARFFR